MPKNHVVKPNLSQAQIEAEVHEYFKGTRHKIEASTCGHVVYLNVEYVGFKPQRTVRNELEMIAPNCYVEEISRAYSNEQIAQAVNECDDSLYEIYVKLGDGTMQRTCLSFMIDTVLQSRTLSKSMDKIIGVDYDSEEKK